MARGGVQLPSLRLDGRFFSPHDAPATTLPRLRDVFPDILWSPRGSDSLRVQGHSHEEHHASGHSGPSRKPEASTWSQRSGILSHPPHESSFASSSRSSTSTQSLRMVAPSEPSGPSHVRFDVLRNDPSATSLRHIASSSTRWTSIPRLTIPSIDNTADEKKCPRKPRRAYYAPGMNPVVDATRAELEHSRANGHGLDAFDAPDAMGWISSTSLPFPYSYGPLVKTSPVTFSPDEHASSSQTRQDDEAARDQAAFEDEVQHSSRNAAATLPACGPPSGPASAKSASPSSPTAGTPWSMIVFPSAASGTQKHTTASGKRKKPCDIERKHICPRCGRAFNRPSSLRVHGRAHTGFRPFVCPQPLCGRMFSVGSNMKRHYRTHSHAVQNAVTFNNAEITEDEMSGGEDLDEICDEE